MIEAVQTRQHNTHVHKFYVYVFSKENSPCVYFLCAISYNNDTFSFNYHITNAMCDHVFFKLSLCHGYDFFECNV